MGRAKLASLFSFSTILGSRTRSIARRVSDRQGASALRRTDKDGDDGSLRALRTSARTAVPRSAASRAPRRRERERRDVGLTRRPAASARGAAAVRAPSRTIRARHTRSKYHIHALLRRAMLGVLHPIIMQRVMTPRVAAAVRGRGRGAGSDCTGGRLCGNPPCCRRAPRGRYLR